MEKLIIITFNIYKNYKILSVNISSDLNITWYLTKRETFLLSYNIFNIYSKI